MREIDGNLKTIMEKMCFYAEVDYEKVDFSAKDWMLKYTWTQEQSDNFEKWLSKFLRDNINAQRELFEMTIKTKRLLQLAVNQFVAFYTFKIK